jgi:hypothetical protein
VSERRFVAAHEAGHAVVAWNYKAWPIRITIGPACDDPSAGGATEHLAAKSIKAARAIAAAGLVADCFIGGCDLNEAWELSARDRNVLRNLGVSLGDGSLMLAMDDAHRILNNRSNQWNRLSGRLITADVLSRYELAVILGRGHHQFDEDQALY